MNVSLKDPEFWLPGTKEPSLLFLAVASVKPIEHLPSFAQRNGSVSRTPPICIDFLYMRGGEKNQEDLPFPSPRPPDHTYDPSPSPRMAPPVRELPCPERALSSNKCGVILDNDIDGPPGGGKFIARSGVGA
jgi:hypothetical protein